jgi:hypothetical protein
MHQIENFRFLCRNRMQVITVVDKNFDKIIIFISIAGLESHLGESFVSVTVILYFSRLVSPPHGWTVQV